ncbi:MAG: Crp/Fnr family transcriptional regulator [Bdellovibrionales bacterium]
MAKFDAQKLLWETLSRWRKTSPEIGRIKFLQTIPFFNDLAHWQLKSVSEIIFDRTYSANEMVFEEGQPGTALFLIVEGKVSIEVYREKFTANLATLEKGSFLGEMALLDGAPRSASARAIEPTKCLALFRNDLDRLINRDPATACQIYRALAQIVGDRLRSTNELVQNGEMDPKVAA